MAYFKIGDIDFSTYVNELSISKEAMELVIILFKQIK